MIFKTKPKQILSGLILICLLGCGAPQIARYPDLNYPREDFKKYLQILWERYPENRVNYNEIVDYVSAIKKDDVYNNYMFKEYINILSIDSLSKPEVERKFFNIDNSENLIIKDSWTLKSEDDSVWFNVRLLYKMGNNTTNCIISIYNIKYLDRGIRWENYETLNKKQRFKISRKFENDILNKLTDLIENPK